MWAGLIDRGALRCPLSFCSNRVRLGESAKQLGTDAQLRVLGEARRPGVAHIGLRVGEPLLRKDPEQTVAEARRLDNCTSLWYSVIGIDGAYLAALNRVALDHIRVSFRGHDPDLNGRQSGTQQIAQKRSRSSGRASGGLVASAAQADKV